MERDPARPLVLENASDLDPPRRLRLGCPKMRPVNFVRVP